MNTPIEFLKGVGTAKANLLQKELGIFTFGDLLSHYPYRHIDRSQFYQIKDLRKISDPVQLKGTLSNLQEIKQRRGSRLTALFSDETGGLELIWFKGIKWIKESLQPGQEYVIYGKPTVYKGRMNLAHPEMELASVFSKKKHSGMRPLYNSTEKMKTKGLDSRGLFIIMTNLIQQVQPIHFYENLSSDILEKYRLISKFQAIKLIHFPPTIDHFKQAQRRLKFEELFFIQLQILALKLNYQKAHSHAFRETGELSKRFFTKVLPFELTNAQKRVITEIKTDLASGFQMNRLLQGDVGSGKTIVALSAMLHAIDNGFQAAIMAPTEILAQQHFNGIKTLTDQLGLNIALLTGSVKGK
ncbi:MAG: DEAD/DEAH box helicase, partial [Bacteroidetes bacterium]|nr:DEAD/DEAH box helicase [Bacteroidota bacterium]